ncbi:STAS domain-containing protein [Winogradskyella sp.]|jgi:anti-anti-sigma regulatory factor|uniref:STAS domain-containing protein n=1 Tax=Winogradskyella sp. TaxID=1883156 RepID=UPI0025F9E330|nr:STAS domain-containing protein [Winogradskyella sp.]MCT4630347.1 STAS domain-containing protein [Winogradskyella sp.]
MALKITENKNVFDIEGVLNTSTTQLFEKHMDALFRTNGDITINIEKVNEIDIAGLAALRQFYKNSIKYNISFTIIGYGCKEIYHDFKNENAA